MSSGPKVIGYCRACGKALDETNVRSAEGTIYCAEHVPLPAAAPPSTASAPSGAHTAQPYHSPASPYAGIPPYTSAPYAGPYAGSQPPPMPTSSPAGQGGSPGLAFVLGMIPGVGAVYNGQYAKGLVHVIIVGVLIGILDTESAPGFEPLIGLLLACFWFYMGFEAYHTAKRRRMGQPLDEFSNLMPMGSRTTRVPVGPIVLIGVGVLFLLNNLDLLDIHRAARYWPAVLIVYGIYLLYLRLGPGRGVIQTGSAASPSAAAATHPESGEKSAESSIL